MTIAALAHRFFMFGGGVLIAVALLQWRLRRRERRDQKASPGLVDAASLRILLFTTVGILAILVGAGVIPMARLR